MWSRTLFAAVAVTAFVAWFAFPGEGGPREGRELCDFVVTGMGPGESVALGFPVVEDYNEMSLNYRLDNASRLRAALTGPDHVRQEAHVDTETNTLDLSVRTPDRGDWRLDLWTLSDPPGGVESGRIFILGFGGAAEPGTPIPADQRCHRL